MPNVLISGARFLRVRPAFFAGVLDLIVMFFQIKGAGVIRTTPAVRGYRRIMMPIKKAKALNMAATSTVTSSTAFAKVNIVFSKLNPEPAQGINPELNVQGHGRHRRISSPILWIVGSGSNTTSGMLNHNQR